MAKVTVMIYTTLRKSLGIAKLELRGRTVREVLDRLCDYKKPEVEKLIHDAEGHVRQHFVLTLNSEILDNKKTAAVKVKDGDILHVFPPVSGG
ncbi:MAG: MoaD/ThiS family protein [Elusimicrobiota bacterium]|nr:MoaD/ThiS family protein [Elusimicrobiota bacterium]